jgi:hypothetical protein
LASASIRFWKDPRSRGKLRKWHDSLAAASPRQADHMWTLMSVVFRVAVRDGLLDINPCAGGEMLSAPGSTNSPTCTGPF